MDDEELVPVVADVDCTFEIEVEEDVVTALVVDVDAELTVFVSLNDPLVVLTAVVAVAVAGLVVDSSAEVVFPFSEPILVFLLEDPAPREDAKTFEVPAAVIVCRLEVEDAVVELP